MPANLGGVAGFELRLAQFLLAALDDAIKRPAAERSEWLQDEGLLRGDIRARRVEFQRSARQRAI
jgi:hypothetical protein